MRIARNLIAGTAAAGLAGIAGCASAPEGGASEGMASAEPAPDFSAEIVRTAYGVPHVKAKDYAGIGYGIGYAAAQDNICELMERNLTATAQRARYLGPGDDDRNIASDLYHQNLIDSGALEGFLNGPADSVDTPSQQARDLARGYAAGVSRFVRETGAANITDPRCKGADWVRELTETDYWRHVLAGQVVIQLGGIVSAAPPGAGEDEQAALDDPLPEATELGSNAYAFGSEATKGGRGVLLGNPHYPWDGQNRFYRIHLMIPGELNVVGAGLVTNATVGIGHTDSIAWTHTVSTARRFGYFELTLNPEDPTHYLYDGAYVPMEKSSVTVNVGEDGASRQVTRDMYSTRFGPVIETETLPWTDERAFAIRVMPQGVRTIDQYIAMWQAGSVRELNAALAKYQATGFNTTAVDSSGEAMFGDLGMIPNVDSALMETCAASETGTAIWEEARIPVLDGSRPECDWRNDPAATAPGIYAPDDLPDLFRKDYVLQSNDSHWLSNVSEPLEGFSPVFGDERTPRSLRTRLAIDLAHDRFEGVDGYAGSKFDLTTLKQVMFNNRHLGAELLRDDLVSVCEKNKGADLNAEVCGALKDWDLRVDLDSRGAHVFHMVADSGGLVFKDKFDADNPATTPAKLDGDAPEVLAALKSASAKLAELEIDPRAALGDVQVETRNGERIPIHGGAGQEGVFNVISVEDLEPKLGWTSIRHGSSWVMAVEFTENGPKSEGVLTYSQSTNPNSPHYSDQTKLYSTKGWDDLLFTEAAVDAAAMERIAISE